MTAHAFVDTNIVVYAESADGDKTIMTFFDDETRKVWEGGVFPQAAESDSGRGAA
jgi:hypothetical protein